MPHPSVPPRRPVLAGGRIATYPTPDGHLLRGRVWTADTTPAHAVFILLHGIQSHSGWYAATAGHLCQAGFRVVLPDRRGSGLNEHQRGHATSAHELIADVARLLRSERQHGLPVILAGLSWGGKLAAAVARRHPELIDGLALLYPGIFSRFELRPDQRLRLGLGLKLGLHHKSLPIPLEDPALFTADPGWRDFIRHDPLALREMTVGFLGASRELDLIARGGTPDQPERALGGPLLLMLSDHDQIVDNQKTLDWFARQPPLDKSLLTYAAQHTLEFEPIFPDYIASLLTWLERMTADRHG